MRLLLRFVPAETQLIGWERWGGGWGGEVEGEGGNGIIV